MLEKVPILLSVSAISVCYIYLYNAPKYIWAVFYTQCVFVAYKQIIIPHNIQNGCALNGRLHMKGFHPLGSDSPCLSLWLHNTFVTGSHVLHTSLNSSMGLYCDHFDCDSDHSQLIGQLLIRCHTLMLLGQLKILASKWQLPVLLIDYHANMKYNLSVKICRIIIFDLK